MALPTRENPENGQLEVLVREEWVPFQDYRTRQINEAYKASVQFLRERLGEDAARKLEETLNTTQSS